MRRVREPVEAVIDKIVALTGVTLVLVQVLHVAETRFQGTVIVIGMLLAVAGAWRIAGHQDDPDSQPAGRRSHATHSG